MTAALTLSVAVHAASESLVPVTMPTASRNGRGYSVQVASTSERIVAAGIMYRVTGSGTVPRIKHECQSRLVSNEGVYMVLKPSLFSLLKSLLKFKLPYKLPSFPQEEKH